MKVVVIVPDRTITVDNKMLSLNDDEWTFDDSHIHAIHWEGTSGELEFVDTSQNIDLTTVDMVQPYIDIFFAELPKIEKLRMEREEQERNAKDTRAAEMQKQQEEQENILRKIRETAEENRRLQDEARLAKRREEEAVVEKKEIEEKLRFEEQLAVKKELRLKLDEEIAAKTRLFDEEIKAKAENLAAVEQTIVDNQNALEQTFNSLSQQLAAQKGDLLLQVNDEREELDRRRKEFLAQKERDQKERDLLTDKLAREQEEFKKKIDTETAQVSLSIEQAEALREEAIAEKINTEKFAQQERESLQKTKELEEQRHEKEQEALNVEQERIQLLQEQLELERQELTMKSQELDMERRTFDDVLASEKTILEARMEDEYARREADRKHVERIEAANADKESAVMKKQMNKIIRQTDPFDIFDMVDRETSYDVKNLPIQEILAFFIKLGRIQTFCEKYNLKYDDIRNSDELTIKLEDWLMNTPNQFTHPENLEGFMSEEYFEEDPED